MRALLILLIAVSVSSLVIRSPLRKSPSLRKKLIEENKWEQYSIERNLRGANGTSAYAVGEPLMDYLDEYYTAEVSFGTPYQNFSLLMHTGSSNTWVINSACTTQICKGTPTSGHTKNLFDTSASSTYNGTAEKYRIGFASTETQGIAAYDRFANQGFGLITSLATQYGEQPIDGIFGLGWPLLAVDKLTPPLWNVLDQLDRPLFTIWLDRHTTPQQGVSGGLLTYGAIDTVNCDSAIDYVPLTAQSYWGFQITGFSLGTYTSTATEHVISDSGTAFIGAPKNVVNAIVAQTGAKYDFILKLYVVPCTNTLTDMTFTINGKNYPIPASEYVLDLGIGGGTCALALFTMEGAGLSPDWILGIPWVRTYCQVYDVGQARIGVTKAHHTEI